MLLGEHAVLHGRRALVCAVSVRVRVQARIRSDRRLVIRSELGEYISGETGVSGDDPRWAFVLETVRRCGAAAERVGLGINIDSRIPAGRGLSSSAAVTVATAAALRRLLSLPHSERDVFEHAWGAVRAVQRMGSGADVAAAVWGGLLVYRATPLTVSRLPGLPELTVVYSGTPARTPEIVRQVAERCRVLPDVFERVFDLQDVIVGEAERELRREEPRPERLGLMLDIGQGLMEALGVSDAGLCRLVYQLRSDPGIWGAKISGAGKGDCVVGLGELRRRHPGMDILDVRAEARGLMWHGTESDQTACGAADTAGAQ